MERQFKPGHEDRPTRLTISTLLGIAHIALIAQTAEQSTYELVLELEGRDTVHSYYVSTSAVLQLEDTLAYQEACEALGMNIDD